jgi:hypothetical protein
MNNRHFWTDERLAQLRSHAANKVFASDIAALFGVTKLSILTVCAKHGIEVAKHTETELTEMRAQARAREKRKHAKRRALTPVNAIVVSVAIGTSRTAPIYRNQLPRLPEMSKNALREMIAQAVRNTAGMTA